MTTVTISSDVAPTKKSSRASIWLHMKQGKRWFCMDIHRSVYCPDVDGKIRSPWNVYFDLMRWFWVLPCAPKELDARFSWHGSPPFVVLLSLHIYIMGYDAYQLGGKPHQLITQMNSITSRYHSKEQCTKPATYLQMQNVDPVKYDPKDQNQSPRRDTVMHTRATTLITCFCDQAITPRPGSNVSYCCWYTSGGVYPRHSARTPYLKWIESKSIKNPR